MNVVLITVCGRKRFLEIQLPYLLRLKSSGIVFEHHLWVNTRNFEDLQFIEEIYRIDPSYFRLIFQTENIGKFEESGSPSVHHVGYMISPFFNYCVDPETIYVRLDDDICFIEVSAFADYIRFREEHPEFFLVFPIIVNNCMDFRIFPKHHPFCQSGYDEEKEWRPKGGQIGLHLHNVFFNHYPELYSLKFSSPAIGHMASVNCISWLGSEFAKFDGQVAKIGDSYEKEEDWLIRTKPEEIGKPNAIFGGMIVCHYAFSHQRSPYHTYFGDGLDLDTTDVLDRYKSLITTNY